ncbi:AAA family ATPase [Escherichia coli]|nr:AAA family ATPase [Escherichia coli]EFA7562836.1 AAA family ATPase [Escherichia coli]EFA7572643.1 AAA family ATPase [Escherichia coli]EFA7577191.1 AAA family ATPase [Escherichia coli]EFA7669537.1 AAA family ATPase [Escherichia coli]
MRLVYFYLAKSFSQDFNLEINLSEDMEIKLSEGQKLCINTDLHARRDRFYGKNIVNVSAIVGKNGIGKSTVLNLLGFRRHEIFNLYPGSQWIAIFENCGDFYLEGSGLRDILGINKGHPSYSSYQMSVEKGELIYKGLVNYTHKITDTYFILHSANVPSKYIHSSELDKNDERNYGLKRNHIKSNALSFYRFITQEGSDFISGNVDRKIIWSVPRSRDLRNEFSFYDDLYRYTDNTSFLSKSKSLFQKDNEDIFITNLLEEYIITLIANIFNDDYDRYYKIIDDDKFSDKNFSFRELHRHLLRLISKIEETLKESGDELIHHMPPLDWHKIIRFVQISNKLSVIPIDKTSHIEMECHITLSVFDPTVDSFLTYAGNIAIPGNFNFPGMSSGEQNLIKKMAGISKSIQLSIDENPNAKGFIILLDEYDENLHPEWARVFLNNLVNFLENKYLTYEFQIIFSTHHPYLLSDLLRDNVIKLEKKRGSNSYVSSKAVSTFASNIYDIMNDSFFLTQTIGEFAVKKINILLGDINKVNRNIDEAEYEEILKKINDIDDDFIRGV